MTRTRTITLIALTPLFILFNHYLTVLPHLYAHLFMAWFLGYQTDIIGIYTASHSFLNHLLLLDVHTKIDYHAIHAMGSDYYLDIAIIALSGPFFTNGALYVVSLALLKIEIIRKQRYFFYFVLWFSLMNLCMLFSYIPIRTFSSQGDMANIVRGLSVSPWFIYITFGYVIAFFIWNFFTNTLIQAYMILDMRTVWQKASFMVLCTLILFGVYGLMGFSDNGDISHFLSVTSLILIPGWIMACWPTRNWVKRQMALPRIGRLIYA